MMKIARIMFLSGCLILLFVFQAAAQTSKSFLGIKLRQEVRAIAEEVERQTKRRIDADFAEFDEEFLLGTSYISDDGTPVLRASADLRADKRKLEAVIAHELLHLRLRTLNYPVFLFSSKVKTMRGLAQDVEQPNVNDLTSLIEHRIFKPEMDKLGLNQILDLAGDTARSAEERAGDEDSQADALNFARAVLEYQSAADVEELRKIYLKNKWQRALQSGQEIADFINRASFNAPEDSVRVFRFCLAKLYPTPRPLKLIPDKSVRAYKQFLISY